MVYCRTSTTRQREADTIEAQRAAARDIIQRYGLEVIPSGPEMTGWWIDDGVSGRLLEGRCLQGLLAEMKSGALRPDYLVVYSLGRLSRIDVLTKDVNKAVQSAKDGAEIGPVLRAVGCKIIDTDGVIDPATFAYDFKLLFAAEDYKGIIRRTSDGKKRHFQSGGFAKGGKPPYGLQQTPRNGKDRTQGFILTHHPEEAPRLCQILEWYAEGGTGYAARMATAAGIPTPMAETTTRKNAAKDWKPHRWTEVTVNNLAKQAGNYLSGELTYVFMGEAYKLKFEPLIKYALFARVERRRQENTRGKQRSSLFTGFTDCVCGAHVSARLSSGHHYARCNGGTKAARKGADHSCGSMRATWFTSYLWVFITARLVQIQRAEGVVATDGPQAFDHKLAAVRDELEKLQGKIDLLTTAYMDKEVDLETFKRFNEPLKQEKARLVAERDRLEAAKKDAAKKAAGEQTIEARVSGLLKELVIGDAKGEVTLARKREVLRDLLQGGRVLVRFGPRVQRGTLVGGSRWVELTLPAFGALPPITVTTDKDIFPQVLGEDAKKANEYASTTNIGRSQADIERVVLRRLQGFGGQATGRKVLPEGVVFLSVEVPAEPSSSRGSPP